MSGKQKDSLEDRVFRKFMHFMLNFEIGNYVWGRMKSLKTYLPKKGINDISKGIINIMDRNKIPNHWYESFASTLTKGEVIVPDHETICLKVGNTFVYSKTFDPEKIRQLKGTNLSIEITGKTSKTEIKQFVDKHNALIQSLTQLLELPNVNIRIGNAWGQNLIAGLSKESGMTYKEMSKILDPRLDDNDPTYSRNKKRVQSERKSRETL